MAGARLLLCYLVYLLLVGSLGRRESSKEFFCCLSFFLLLLPINALFNYPAVHLPVFFILTKNFIELFTINKLHVPRRLLCVFIPSPQSQIYFSVFRLYLVLAVLTDKFGILAIYSFFNLVPRPPIRPVNLVEISVYIEGNLWTAWKTRFFQLRCPFLYDVRSWTYI